MSKKKGKWEAKVMVNRRWAYRELFDRWVLPAGWLMWGVADVGAAVWWLPLVLSLGAGCWLMWVLWLSGSGCCECCCLLAAA